MKPLRYEGDVAIFTTDMVDVYGPPCLYGYENYMVIESPPQLVSSYADIERTVFKRIHRYRRIDRFRFVLRNLLGYTNCKIDETYMVAFKTFFKTDSETPYEDIRKIIKHYGLGKMHTLIPSILRHLGVKPPLVIDTNFDHIYRLVIRDFQAIETAFNSIKEKGKYFPNMKYIAIRLLERRGIDSSGLKPLRTKRKLKAADLFFEELVSKASFIF